MAGAAAISRQLAAAGAALATSGAAHHLQTSRRDLQDTADISAGISRSTHHDTKQHAVIAIVVRATAACPIQTNFLQQTLFQHCSTICLELSPCLSSEL